MAAPDSNNPDVLAVEELSILFATDDGPAEVLDHISLSVRRGEVLGVVGESGCGKSTLVRSILGILPRAARIRGGRINLRGRDLLSMSERDLTREVRGNEIGFIPQDPFLALNPVFRVGDQLLEIMRWNAPAADRARPKAHRERLIELFQLVQIPDPTGALSRYPHEFSGGQRQRILIAAALSCEPSLIIADEPTTALDVTTQLEILRLIDDLRQRFQLAVLFVTHDFGVVAQLCDRVAVIYAGQVAEIGPTAAVLEDPKHPYTRLLIACHPDRAQDLVGIPGTVPRLVSPPSGCRFHPRCPDARARCREARPAAAHTEDRVVHCVLYEGDHARADAAVH